MDQKRLKNQDDRIVIPKKRNSELSKLVAPLQQVKDIFEGQGSAEKS